MKFFKKSFSVVISIILCITLMCQSVTASFWGNKTLYLKDIKIIYADSEKEAEDQLPDGYKLFEGNLNEGTGELGVYICYSTTENPDEAITDIKAMHESGGFERTDFKASLNDAIEGVYGLAKEMTTAVNEFIQNYNNGVPAAIYAKEALNYFQYDTDTLLGDFMLSGTGTYQDFGRMILMCHEDILNPILSLLALGVQQKAGENWIDRLANVDPTAYSSAQDSKYRERATKLRPILQQFNDIYCYVMGYYDTTYTYEDLTDENDKELFTQMAENKDMFTVLQTILRSYSVGTNVNSQWAEWATAEDMFTIGLNTTLNMYESYALLECLTPGQEIMLRLTGPYNFIIGSQNTDEVLGEARKAIVENLNTEEKIPIWDGVNLDIFEQEVGLTNAAQRSIAAGKQYDIFAKDVDTLAQKYRDIASVVSSSFTIASSAILVTKCAMVIAPKFFSFISCSSIASAISSFASAAIVSTIMTVTGAIFTVASIVCSIIITFFLEDIIAWMMTEEYDRTTIPKYMVDEVVNKEGISTYAYYQRVDNVRSDQELGLDTEENESGSDINVNEGYRWMALYTSNKPSLGNPIKADFLLETETGTDKEGYAPLAMFGKTVAENLNGYADKVSSKYPAIYLHYSQDKITPVVSEKYYISHILVESGKHEDQVKKKLADSGYLVYNHNFGCKTNEVTFIGYKLTANANDAVRDVRLLYNCNSSNVKFGELNYGSMGTIGNFSLMVSSTNTNPAPPVLHLAVYEKDVLPDATLGYEPVNEFSGGMAHPLGASKYRLYFLPETTFTSGPDYLAGIKTDVYYYNTYSGKTKYKHPYRYYEHNDMFGNNVENYRAYKSQNYGEQFIDFSSSVNYYFQGHENADSHNTVNLGYKYTTTKNPYRAIYGISANQRNGLDRFDDSVTFAGEGFVIAAAEFSSASRLYTGDKFIYSPEANESEFGEYYTDYSTNTDSELRYYTSKNSSGKADAWVENLGAEWNVVLHTHNYVFNQDITHSLYNDDMNALYISGYQTDRTPLTVDDVIVTKQTLEKSDKSTSDIGVVTATKLASEEGKYPANFTPVVSMIGDSADPTNVAPSNGEAFAGYYGDSLTGKEIYVTLYDKTYMYFRNEKTVSGKAVAQKNIKEGKYISSLFLASKEEIREKHNKKSKDGKEILCENLNKSVVENSLFGKGATTTFDLNIGTDYTEGNLYKSFNYVCLGIQRSDNPNKALTDIRIYVAKKGERPEQEIKRTITYEGETFDVKYNLVDQVSITDVGNSSDAEFANRRQAYIYTSSHPALGDPITEIKMDDIFSYHDFEPVLTMDNRHIYTVSKESWKKDKVMINLSHEYSLYGNNLSFKREGHDKPYIQDIEIVVVDRDPNYLWGEDVSSAYKLIELGYTDVIRKDMNEKTTFKGQLIHIGMKRTADKNDAVYDVVANNDEDEDPPQNWNQYALVSKSDLNAETIFGPYIYLYQTKAKNSLQKSPITDIKAVDENYQTVNTSPSGKTMIGPGDITYQESFVINQDADKQDFNEGAGGDYIYLVTTKEVVYEMQLAYLGSMLGTGSYAVVALFLAAAAVAIIYVKLNIKHNEDLG